MIPTRYLGRLPASLGRFNPDSEIGHVCCCEQEGDMSRTDHTTRR